MGNNLYIYDTLYANVNMLSQYKTDYVTKVCCRDISKKNNKLRKYRLNKMNNELDDVIYE